MKIKSLKMDALLQLFSKGGGVTTGYYDLDRLMGGIHPGSLIIIAGSTGMGKSLFAINLLARFADAGGSCMYFDLENGRQRSFERILRIRYDKPPKFFDDFDNIGEAKSLLDKSETMGFGYVGHETLYEKGLDKHGYKLVIKWIEYLAGIGTEIFLIDPLQVLETAIDSGAALNEQGKIIQELKELAQRLNVVIFVCHHLRKTVGGSGDWLTDFDDEKDVKYRVPSIDDLRGSGKIADFCTAAWGMVRTSMAPTKEGRGKTLLKVMKNRDGNTGSVKLFFDTDTLKFHSVVREKGAIDLFDGKV